MIVFILIAMRYRCQENKFMDYKQNIHRSNSGYRVVISMITYASLFNDYTLFKIGDS